MLTTGPISLYREFLDALSTTSGDHLCLIDRSGRLAYVNAHGANLLGVPANSLVGKPLHEVGILPACSHQITKQCELVFAGLRAEPDYLDTHDAIPSFFPTFTPIPGENGRIDYVLYRTLGSTEPGITREELTADRERLALENADLVRAAEAEAPARENAQHAAQENKERLQLALDAARMGWWEWDIRTGDLKWSDNLEEVNGMEPGSFDGTFDGFMNVVHPGDQRDVMAAIAQALENKTHYSVEFRVTWFDGTIHWVAGEGQAYYDEAGAPVRMLGIATDVTERKNLQAALKDAYEKERRIAETLQKSYLNKIHQKTFAELDIETYYQAAWNEAQVGGDFYDVFPLEGGKVALVVGDVSGKGLDAAARTAEIKFTLRGLLREDPDARSAITRINAILHTSQALEDTEGFVCLTLVVVDLDDRTAVVTAAGIEPPLLLRSGGATEMIAISGTPLGVTRNCEYDTAAVTLNPGDILLLSTDGLTEARRGREFLGYDGLTELAKAALSADSLAHMGESIVEGALTFAGGALKDDVCLLLCRAR